MGTDFLHTEKIPLNPTDANGSEGFFSTSFTITQSSGTYTVKISFTAAADDTTAPTVAAGAFIGASVTYGSVALVAISTSDSIEGFNAQGNWGTVATTSLGATVGGVYGYGVSRTQLPHTPANPGIVQVFK